MGKLTPKQDRFCREYLIDLNGTQAAIRAGYSKRAAQQIATENLLKPVIKAEIERLKAERVERTEINADFVLAKINSILLDPEARNSDKLKAAKLLGRHLGLFKDNIKVESNIRHYADMTPTEREARAAEMIETIIAKRSIKLGKGNPDPQVG